MRAYSIFISHSWAYGDAYEKLIKLLDSDSRFTYRDYSIPKNDPIHNAANRKLLAAAIMRQMRFCEVIIILAGVYSTHSKWINEEIAIANSFTRPKPILAIEPRGSERTSAIVKKYASKVVSWNTSSILAGIRELS